jgi:hypothetical protein
MCPSTGNNASFCPHYQQVDNSAKINIKGIVTELEVLFMCGASTIFFSLGPTENLWTALLFPVPL